MNDPLPIPVDTKLVLGVVHTAVEGGSCSVGMGWAQLESYRWSQWYEPDKELDTPRADMTKDTVLLRIGDHEDTYEDVPDDKMVDLTLGMAEEAIQWTLTNYPHLGGYEIHKNTVTDWDHDAIGADVALQKAVLGEVVYG
jgi:hypothetical protein